VAEVNEYLSELEAVNSLLVAEAQATKPDVTLSEEETAEDLASELERQLAEGTASDDVSGQISPLFSLLKSNQGLVYEIRDTVAINRILAREDVKSLLPRNVKFLWAVKPQVADNMELLELFGIKYSRTTDQAPLEGDVITDARQTLDQTSRPAVSMQMNADGARRWRKITSESIG
jgi:SecD/SecF fusion protein